MLNKPDCREKPGVQRGLEAKSRTEITEVLQALLFLLSFIGSIAYWSVCSTKPMTNEL